MRIKIIKRVVDGLQPGTCDHFLWDSEVRGFGVKITPSGKRIYVLQYRMGGRGAKTQRVTIGDHGSPWTADNARSEALRLLGQVNSDENPAEQRRVAREVQRSDRLLGTTIADLAHRFVERYAKTETESWRETKRILDKDVLPLLGDAEFKTVTRAMVIELVDRIRDRDAPMSARNAFKVIRRMYRWAHGRGELEINPIAGLDPPVKERPRHRVLTDDEIRTLWSVWSKDGGPFNDACKIMLLTAQRVHEVSRMAWSEIDSSWNWTIPATRYKTRIPHVVPISGPVREIIDAAPRLHGTDLVFAFGPKPTSGWSKAKGRMHTRAEAILKARAVEFGEDPNTVVLAPWQLRDLRRTGRTLMTRAGVDFHVAERVIGHVISGVAGVYDRWDYLPEKRRALEAHALTLQQIVSGDVGEVVPLKRRVSPASV